MQRHISVLLGQALIQHRSFHWRMEHLCLRAESTLLCTSLPTDVRWEHKKNTTESKTMVSWAWICVWRGGGGCYKPSPCFWMFSMDMLREGTSLVSRSTSKGTRKATHATCANLYLVKNKNKKKWSRNQMIRNVISANQHVFVENRSNKANIFLWWVYKFICWRKICRYNTGNFPFLI